MKDKDTIRSGEDMQRERLEQRYREHRGDGPPPDLDRAVLARAHRTLARERDVNRNRRRWNASRGAWLTGVATASVALLALTVVLQQAAPPTRNAESADLFNPGAPTTSAARRSRAERLSERSSEQLAEPSTEAAPDLSSDAEFQVFARQRREADAEPSDAPRQRAYPELQRDTAMPESAEARASMEDSARTSLEESAEALGSERESSLRMPADAFDTGNSEAYRTISAESIRQSIDAGDPPERIKKARRALLIRVQVKLARGDAAAARELIEEHRTLDPDFEMPSELAERLSTESPPEPG